jgi:hypothetical protein
VGVDDIEGSSSGSSPQAASAPAVSAPSVSARTGTLQIESRPSGAGVWLDGAPAGKTPLSLADVRPGTHTVRIEQPGYRPWSTSVSIAAGQHERVAASLER